MKIERVSCFIDGFNLYHALDDLGEQHLKWLNLWSLMQRFAVREDQRVIAVYYFSAFATWLPDAYKRHREYVRALQAVGVTPVMGFFKNKDRKCNKCGSEWVAHEEKETDVNIGIHRINEVHKNTFDHAFLVTNDSDLSPVVGMLSQEFEGKRLRLITPPKRRVSKALLSGMGNRRGDVRTIKVNDVRKNLFPERVKGAVGMSPAIRPAEYAPPT